MPAVRRSPCDCSNQRRISTRSDYMRAYVSPERRPRFSRMASGDRAITPDQRLLS